MKKIFLPFCLSLMYFSSAAMSEIPRWYEVELLIFKRNTDTDEQWPDPKPVRSGKVLYDFVTSQSDLQRNGYILAAQKKTTNFYVEDSPFLLTRASYEFRDRIQLLKKHHKAEPLLHMTWMQGMRSQTSSQPIKIVLGENFANRYRPNGYRISDTEDLPQKNAVPIREISGYIDFYIDHYLYIDANLALRQEVTKRVKSYESFEDITPLGSSNSFSFLEQIPFQQKKHVRSGEIHYFDHPYLGMIVQIRRIKEQPQT